MHDIKKQSYGCEFYKQTVLVHVKREHCSDGEYCSMPKPHITDEYFHSCSDILNCGVGKIIDGQFVTPNLHICPAFFSLDVRKEKL